MKSSSSVCELVEESLRKQKMVTSISTISRGARSVAALLSELWVLRCMFSIHIAMQV